MRLIAILTLGLASACTHTGGNAGRHAAGHATVVGSCAMRRDDLQIDLCAQYDLPGAADAHAAETLRASCEKQAEAKGQWQTSLPCSLSGATWQCEAHVDAATMHMQIAGSGATPENAKIICDAFPGSRLAGASAGASADAGTGAGGVAVRSRFFQACTKPTTTSKATLSSLYFHMIQGAIAADALNDVGSAAWCNRLADAVTRSDHVIAANGVTAATDLSPILLLTHVTRLELWGQSYANLGSLRQLPKLRRLNLSNVPDLDLDVIATLPLQELEVRDCGITDLSPLAAMTSLTSIEVVNASGTNVKLVKDAEHCPETARSPGVAAFCRNFLRSR